MNTKVVRFNYKEKKIFLELRPDTQDEPMARSEVFDNYYFKYGKLEIKSGDTVIDLGANIGSFTIAAGILGAKKIVAVEPHPDTLTLLKKNIESNREYFSDPVTVFEGAVMGNGESKGPLYVSNDPYGSGSHTLNLPEKDKPENHKQIEVSVTSLDELIKNTIGDGTIDFLKLDIEGAEYEVLTTCQNLNRIRQISLEWHYGPANFAGLLSFLVRNNFSVAWFEGDNNRGKLQVKLNNI
jgi:FkbM family methyltransferase